MVSRLKHENVLQLLGYCMEGPVRVLCYEYCANGSLHDYIHGKDSVSERGSCNEERNFKGRLCSRSAYWLR